VDDETFLNMMDGQNFGIDMNPTFDVDDDGILPSTFDDEYASDLDGDVCRRRRNRQPLEPNTGNEQPGETYWKRIYEQFLRNNKSGIFRTQISIAHQRQTIQVSCTKWASCLKIELVLSMLMFV
jgi:hypothetical protein